jgi:hypothetical protein
VFIFFLVVVVGPPSFSFFFQQARQGIAFWHQRLVGVAGWLWRFLQADQKMFDFYVRAGVLFKI